MTWEILGTETDKKLDLVTIFHSDKLALSPGFTFFLREFADLADRGHSHPATVWNDSQCGIIWAEIDNTVVGIIVYDKQYIDSSFSYLAIQLTAVKEEFRQRGIHSTMNKYFEKIALRNGCYFIRATVNVRNSTRFITAEKDGLIPRLVVLNKDIL